ncbi:HSP20 family protein [Haloferula luteola]|uniref:HSP20 family protein n=1 Tax=Haloferula luteola TaxID=595692 RepID=A0A840VAN6_9BACT|nr:Hsp20/alpha crystallin family protein [Haloferula luteola]MBB5352614.1 HSP20 family protein [Haloferula luteola]
MNTCCNETTAVKSTPTAAPTETSFSPPHWRAFREESGVNLEVVLPGVKRDDLKLEVQASHLVLEATRAPEAPLGKLIHGSSAPTGYRLKLRISESLDAHRLTAKLADGILRLQLPLVETAQPKRIEVE